MLLWLFVASPALQLATPTARLATPATAVKPRSAPPEMQLVYSGSVSGSYNGYGGYSAEERAMYRGNGWGYQNDPYNSYPSRGRMMGSMGWTGSQGMYGGMGGCAQRRKLEL